MKPEELSIGDWINIMFEGYDNPTQIKEVGPFWVKVTQDEKEYRIALIVPIPITPEILEKNGFVIKKKWAQMGNFGDSPLIMWHFEDEPILRGFKHELEIHQNDTGKVHIQIPCEYVHQLQHALRLCGITKTIEP